jgi:hypothetical protein
MKTLEGQVDSWAFLGDYDDPIILKQIIELKKDRIITIGNHDCFYASPAGTRFAVGSAEMQRLMDLWKEHENEREFVLDCIENSEEDIFGVRIIRESNLGKLMYVHASFGNTTTQCLNDRFYYEAEREEAIADNFRNMVSRDIKILFRGHDHLNRILSSDLNGKNIREENVKELIPFSFELNRRYAVSVGGFFDNHYAVHDEEGGSIVLY